MEHLNKMVENIFFFQDVDWVKLFKRRLGCFIFIIYVVMELLSSMFKKCVWFDGGL